jgi:hypothetical protein
MKITHAWEANLRTANRFWTGIFVLILLYGITLCSPAIAFDGQRGECPACESSFIDNWEYPQDWELLWDPANPEEIGENSSVNVSVIGGVSPYKWSVSGTGFWLSSDQTEGLSNTLNAYDTACGSAEIKVTDGFGDIVIGYVRCAVGTWLLVDSCDEYNFGVDSWGTVATAFEGKYRYQDDWCYSPPACAQTCEGGPCPQHTTAPPWGGTVCYVEASLTHEWVCP